MKKMESVNICRQICVLADELRDRWLQQYSLSERREIMALTVSQQRMLRVVWRMTEISPQGIMLKELAERLSLSCSAVSVMVEAMVRRGVFERVQDEEDRRKVFIRISPAGLRQANIADQDFAEVSAGFFAGLSDDEVTQMTNLLEKFQQYLVSIEKENKK